MRVIGNFGFSYIGFIFLLLLFIPNIIWIKKVPKDYISERENRVLLIFERIGQMLVSIFVLIFSDFNIHRWTTWSWWLVASLLLMLLYELWWVRYFNSERKLTDFYSSFLGIPVAGATLPVIAFLFLGIYGKVICLIISVFILGIGHIGIHLQHYNQIKKE